MFHGIPVIGIVGGIGSGKSFIARLFGELGCEVIDSDQQVSAAYDIPEVQETLRKWWGDEVLADEHGGVRRKAIAARIFQNPAERHRLESLIHPIVARLRQKQMDQALPRKIRPVAFIWDTPLLFETGLNVSCDAIIFVDASEAVRMKRVEEKRGWSAEELFLREKSQWGLDKKKSMSQYTIVNTASETPPGSPWPSDDLNEMADPAGGIKYKSGDLSGTPARNQVRLILSQIVNSLSGSGQATGLQ